MKLAEALKIAKEKNLRKTREQSWKASHARIMADPVRHEKRKKKNAARARARYARIKADPVAYQEYLAKRRVENSVTRGNKFDPGEQMAREGVKA